MNKTNLTEAEIRSRFIRPAIVAEAEALDPGLVTRRGWLSLGAWPKVPCPGTQGAVRQRESSHGLVFQKHGRLFPQHHLA